MMESTNLQLIAVGPLQEMLGGISTMTISRWIDAGKFPPPLIADGKRHRLWRVSDVAAWQENMRTPDKEKSEAA